MSIKLLLIEDSALDRRLFNALLLGGHGNGRPWLYDVLLTEASGPLANLVDYIPYDGVIIDYTLNAAVTGYELAQQLHAAYPELPLMLLTGRDPASIERDVLDYADYVAWKGEPPQTQAYFAYDIFHTTRAFLRMIARGKLSEDRNPPA